MRAVATGALLGLVASAGLLLIVAWHRARRPARVAQRIGPFLAPGSAPRVEAPGGVLAQALRRSGRGHAVTSGLRSRLDRAGSVESTGHYRLEQVAWGACGACAGGVAALLIGAAAPPGVMLLAGTGAIAGALARDWSLARRARGRRLRIDEQLPAVAELLAFAVAAGESAFSALDRVARSMTGELVTEVGVAVADVRSGAPLERSLMAMADRTGSATVRRFVDGLVLAIDRGTPLADVLRAQAADARSAGRRRLMETAGRKDVAMLVPVVFLVLPTVVAVALFPGLQGLRLVVP